MDIVEQLRATPETGADPDMIFEAADLIERLRGTVRKLASLAQHSDGCSWITPLPTGQGYWGCDCGLNDLVLDGEPTDAALTPNRRGKRPSGVAAKVALDRPVGRHFMEKNDARPNDPCRGGKQDC